MNKSLYVLLYFLLFPVNLEGVSRREGGGGEGQLTKGQVFELSTYWCSTYCLVNKIIFFVFFYRKIHVLTSEFHGRFHAKNRYRMQRTGITKLCQFKVKREFY